MEGDSSIDAVAVVHRFLHRYMLDREEGRELGLDEYQRLFPGYEEAIARKFEEIRSGSAALAVHDDGSARTRLGRFRLLRELGRGGQAVVYLAEDPRLGRQVALKVLRLAPGYSEDARQRFLREAESAARLEHPGICSVHETGEVERQLYLAMRYVEGESLADILARQRERAGASSRGSSETRDASDTSQPPSRSSDDAASEIHRSRRSVALIEEAARAIHAAHEAGVVHRDLKPANIMVTPSGRPVVLDFGLARAEDAVSGGLTLTGDRLGTPAYMSPEQIRGQRRAVDRRTDVYALAVTLYECLALQRPFEAPTRHGLYRAILTGHVADLRGRAPQVSRDLQAVAEKGLALDPRDRYATARDLADELGRVRRGETVRARRAGPVLRVVRWGRRHRLAAALAGCVIATLVTALVVVAVLLGRTRTIAAESRHLADVRALPYLRRVADEELWPPLPDRRADIDVWLDEAQGLLARAPQYRDALEPRTAASSDGDGARATERARLAELVENPDAFEQLVSNVRWRREMAATVEQRSLVDAAAAWDDAIKRVAAPRPYGFDIEPQLGLVPLGPDPDTGFEEFAHVLTGEVPRRDPATNRLELREQSGVVLVLLPGGTFWMGARLPDDAHPVGSPNVDPDSEADFARPVHQVPLAPFFLSKYEMTQGQWLRITGENPSYYGPGEICAGIPSGATLLHPVDSVTWVECDRTVRRVDLVLPTEAQWEYACRAGTGTRYYTGRDVLSLVGHENLCDPESAALHAALPRPEPDFSDGHAFPAPVGSFHANPFGLHDMQGNLQEWCRDVGARFAAADVAPGDGERLAQGRCRVRRGGSLEDDGIRARVSRRVWTHPETLSMSRGLRPARAIRSRRAAGGDWLPGAAGE